MLDKVKQSMYISTTGLGIDLSFMWAIIQGIQGLWLNAI